MISKPTPEQIKEARKRSGLTQTQAAEVIHKKLLAWQRYEAGDRGMDTALFELETPPRAWGRPPLTLATTFAHGNTPTGVGKTMCMAFSMEAK